MNRQVNAIAGRLSLRPPQRKSLEILDRLAEIAPPRKQADLAAILEVIRSEFPTVTDFEREFPSVCFALATGVGKTRLMGAFISYLHLAHGLNNFFVLAPNLTIYRKLIADFTPNTPKYVFRGIAEFATSPPQIITGEDYETAASVRGLHLIGSANVNIFNISKINSEVRGGKSPRIKRLSEYIGESYFDYLAALPDLVLIMDESHRYRASAGVRAINELKPVMGLELTATPFVESAKGPLPFRNVIFDYPLGKAMADGFVKEPAVVTRKDFNPAGMSDGEIERIKLEDGVRIHEAAKVELETYALASGGRQVKPFLLVIARDTSHAAALLMLIESQEFFEGRYAGKVIQVDSSTSGAESDEVVSRLLRVEDPAEPTEIVIHVNMLKEGWDVTNLYTIVPLRAANARTLIEQSIGRGLRLPYGQRTGVVDVDRLNIVAHDRFQEIVDEAKKSDSAIRLQQIVLSPEALTERLTTVVSVPVVSHFLGVATTPRVAIVGAGVHTEEPMFRKPEDVRAAEVTLAVVREMAKNPSAVPVLSALERPDVLAAVEKEVAIRLRATQLEIDDTRPAPNVAAVVAATVSALQRKTIAIPRIVVVPRGESTATFTPFDLDLSALRYPPVSEELWIQHLRTQQVDVLAPGGRTIEESRDENYVVAGLVDYDDISYQNHADLLWDLASQVVEHLRAYLTVEDARNVLRYYQKPIVELVHTQMAAHFKEEAADYEVKVTRGFVPLKDSAYTKHGELLDFHHSPIDKSNMSRYLFGGFARCLYEVQKFHSDSERRMALILDRDSLKWFRPADGQFQILYRSGVDHREYIPDFVAESDGTIYMIEVKQRGEVEDTTVLAKRRAAEAWCRHASEYNAAHGEKPWMYVLIPHDTVAENMTLRALVGAGSMGRESS